MNSKQLADHGSTPEARRWYVCRVAPRPKGSSPPGTLARPAPKWTTTQPDDQLWSAIGDPSRRRVPHQVLWWQRLGRLDVGDWLAQRPQKMAAQGLAAVMLALASWQVFGWLSTFQPVIGDVAYAIELVAVSPAMTYLGTAQTDFQSLGLWSVIGICGWLISENGLIGRRPVPDLVVRGGQARASAPALQVPLSRQAVAEHLAVLEQAGLSCRKEGREVLYQVEAARLDLATRVVAELANK